MNNSSKRLLKLMSACLLVCFAVTPTLSETDSIVFPHPDEIRAERGFIVAADRRIFAVMAFINAVGYDEEAEGQKMHPVRVKLRQMVARNLRKCPDQLQKWKEYYKRKAMPEYVYQDFALTFNGDYPFRKLQTDNKLTYPKAAKELADLSQIVNEFWCAADLEKVWNELKPDFIRELQQYQFEKMRDQLAFVWQYLRLKRTDNHTLVNIPNLLNARFNASGAQYGNFIYSVESPESHNYSLNIHEYLHLITNPILRANFKAFEQKLKKYYEKGKTGELVKGTYEDPMIFAQECLARALDERISARIYESKSQSEIEDRINSISKQGLTLVGPFYRALAEYEASGKSFDAYMPVMLKKLK